MTGAPDIRVNRAPVLTLWAAIVAERLGHDPDSAILLGRFVAGSSARAKARAIGIEEEGSGPDRERPEGTAPRAGHAPEATETVHLLGRDIPVQRTRTGLRTLDEGKPASPRAARSYVERAFGAHLTATRAAMERLAASLPPEALNRHGFRLYEQFRPEVPAGARGWGARGVLDLDRIGQLAGSAHG